MENERQQRFIDLLNQIFELDKSDLDFGIYRILNIRKKEIEDFFKVKLPTQITEILKPFASQGKEEIVKQIEDLKVQLGDDIESLPETVPVVVKYKELKAQLQQGTDISALESDVYSALYSFFSRYYDEGDFISKRRYKEGVYAIPYEGEEVKLYWANQDQYYIKTSENFKDYTFKTDSYTIHFRLVDATTEQNNNKETADKKRQFMLFKEDEENYPGIKTFEMNDNELIIRFVYDVPEDPKVKYAELNLDAIRQYLVKADTQLQLELLKIANPDAEKKKQVSVLEKHLKGYVAKNTFDYFIHKDLGGFLTRELDFFIKNEIMHLDDLDTQSEQRVNTYLAKVRAIKRVGTTIIDFLAQIENFQKKLWLKKKFVVETNWCITLDRIDECFYDEIRKNKVQIEEWKQMYAIDEIVNDAEHTEPWTEVPSVPFLRQNQNLVVDTKHFSDEFKMRLLASIDKIEEVTSGILLKSDNYQALQLISKRFEDCVSGCYIDPPFNLGENADYLYRVDYKDSTWLSLLSDRIEFLKNLLKQDGYLFVRCSHDGNMLLRMLLNEIYGSSNYRNEIILRRAEESKGELNKQFETIKSITVNYDNLYWYSKSSEARFQKIIKPANEEQAPAHWHSFWKAMDRPTMRYELLGINLNQHYGQWMWEKNRAFKAVENYKYYVTEIEPTGESLEEYWERTGKQLEFVRRNGNTFTTIQYWIPPRTLVMADTNWLDIKGYANKWGFKTENSEGVVKRIIDNISNENDYVIDFFLGSGTTTAVALKTGRKFIGVEMGEQFNDTILPRMKMVLNGEQSGVSSLCAYKGGGMIKYMRLESYEDALSNISLHKQDNMQRLFGDDYLINYMLDLEAKGSLLNHKAFATPFEYEMKITEKNECKQQRVDVCETFNYLIGLTVEHQGVICSYNATPAAKPEYEGAVDLKNSENGQYQFRQIEGKLRDGRKALIIWRNITDNKIACNAALDAYFQKYRTNSQNRDYDVIFVNGDSNLENLRLDDESWNVLMIETEFNKRMFEE